MGQNYHPPKCMADSKGLERHVVHGIALAEGPQRALVDPETNPENHGTPNKNDGKVEIGKLKTTTFSFC